MSIAADNKAGILAFYSRVIIRPHFRAAVLICGLMISSVLLEILTIGIAIPLLDAVTDPRSSTSSKVIQYTGTALTLLGLPASTSALVLALLVIANVLFVCRSAFVLLYQYLTARTGHQLRRETRCVILQRFLYASYEELSRRGRGAILHAIEVPSNAIYSAITQLATLFTAVFNTVFMLVFMIYLSWWATLVIGMLAVFGIYGSRKLMDKHAREAGLAIHGYQADQRRLQVDAVDGIRVIKLHVIQTKIQDRLRSLLEAEEKPALKMALLRNLPELTNEFAASIIVLLLAIMTFLLPAAGMSFSTLVAFLVTIRRCSPSVATINSSFVQLNALRADLDVIDEVLYQLPNEARGRKPVSGIQIIEFDDVSFRYPSRSEQAALHRVNLLFRKGSITAIVGQTGSGKSTIANLIVGFWAPDGGHIRIDGDELRDLNLDDWRSRIGYVSQDVFLFNGSIRENLALWNESVEYDGIHKAARIAQLDDFVSSLPGAYDTPVGDRGLNLSGGQCQRIAIAREILKKPDVLIFDEATSALDNLTERAFYEAINALRDDAVIIVIAHRLSTLKEADQIVVMDAGRVVQCGTHSFLLEQGGAYSKLYELEPTSSS